MMDGHRRRRKASEEEEIQERRVRKTEEEMKGIDSFAVSHADDISIVMSRVNVFKVSRNFLTAGMKANRTGFRQYFFVNRSGNKKGDPFPFFFTYIFEGKKLPPIHALSLVKYEVDKSPEARKNSIKFTFKKKGSFIVEYKFEHDFKKMLKFLKLRMSVNQGSSKIGESPKTAFRVVSKYDPSKAPSLRNEIINNYRPIGYAETIKSVVRGISTAVTATGASISAGSFNSGEEEEGTNLAFDLMNQESRKWTSISIFKFMKQIPVLDDRNQVLISLFTYIESQGLKLDLEEVLSPARNFQFLMSNIERFKESKKHPKNEALVRILKNKVITERLLQHYRFLKFLNFRYHACFYVILKKHLFEKLGIVGHEDKVRRGFTSSRLKLEENELFFVHRHLWSQSHLERRILFIFCFESCIPTYIRSKTKEFEKLVRKHEKKHSWLQILAKFNKKYHLKLQNLSFKVKSVYRHHELKENRRKLISEIKKHEEELEETKKRVFEDTDLYKKFTKMMNNPKNDDTKKEKYKKNLAKFSVRFKNTQKKDLKKKHEEIEKKKTEVTKLEQIIIKSSKQKPQKQKQNMMMTRSEQEWFFSVNYNKSLDDMTERRLNDIFNPFEKGMKQDICLTSKLVLSRSRKKKKKSKQGSSTKSDLTKLTVDTIRTIFNPDSLRFGFIAGRITLCNVSFSWYGSAIVCVEDMKRMGLVGRDLEDLACFDAHQIIFRSPMDVLKLVRKISRLIIDWNTNYVYSHREVRIVESSYEKNCQEFAMFMLGKKGLDTPLPFYPRIDSVIDKLALVHFEKMKEMRSSSNSSSSSQTKGKTSDDEYRYVELTEEIPEVMRKKSRSKYHGKQNRHKHHICIRVYFKTHAILDSWMNDCLDICPDMEVLFPGVYQLVKSFDRAFWLQRIQAPSKINRPLMSEDEELVDCHFHHGGRLDLV